MTVSTRTRRSRYLVQIESVDGFDTNLVPIIRSGQTATFTRGGATNAAESLDSLLKMYLVNTNEPRSQFVTDATDGISKPAWLLEAGSTNLVVQASHLDTTWAAVGTPTFTSSGHTTAGVRLNLIGDDAAGTLEGYTQTVTFTGNAAKAVSCYVKKGTSTSAAVRVRDTSAGADRLLAIVTWSGTVPSVAMTTGTYLGAITHYDGVYRLLFQTTSVTAANTNSLQVYPATDAALSVANTGDLYAGGFQAENALVPSSYLDTTTATVTRTADAFSIACNIIPQAMTVYAKWVEMGTTLYDAAGGVVYIGDAAGTDPDFYIGTDGGQKYRGVHYDKTSTAAATPVIGNTVEGRAVLQSDGSVYFGQSINAAAEVVAATSATKTLGAAWSGQTLYVNSLGTASKGLMALLSIRIAAGTKTLAQMQAG